MSAESDDHSKVEEELAALLDRLGIPQRSLELTPDELARTDADAERVLTELLRQQRSPRQRRLLSVLRTNIPRIAVAVGVVALLTAVFVVRLGGEHPAHASTPPMLQFPYVANPTTSLSGRPASSQFLKLATAASQAKTAGSGDVQLIRLDAWWLETDQPPNTGASSRLVPTRSDNYFLPDGTVRLIESRGAALDPNGRLADGGSNGETTSNETFEGPETGPDYAAKLATDPDRLVRQLMNDGGGCEDQQLTYCLVTATTQLHYTYVVPPQLASALWKVLSERPDVTYLGKTRDRLNRAALAFAAPGSDESRQIVIFADPDTGAFLGNEEILIADSSELGLEAPAVVEFTALALSERVRRTAADAGRPTPDSS